MERGHIVLSGTSAEVSRPARQDRGRLSHREHLNQRDQWSGNRTFAQAAIAQPGSFTYLSGVPCTGPAPRASPRHAVMSTTLPFR